MLEFMRDGGALMWPLLGVGMLAIASATRRAIVGDGGPLPERLARVVVTAAIGWSLMGIIVVLRAAKGASTDLLLQGLSEALTPAVLGLMVHAATTLVGAIGAQRLTARS